LQNLREPSGKGGARHDFVKASGARLSLKLSLDVREEAQEAYVMKPLVRFDTASYLKGVYSLRVQVKDNERGHVVQRGADYLFGFDDEARLDAHGFARRANLRGEEYVVDGHDY
jgi:hypothetical protein